jgi:hypothetical protein
MQVRVSFVVDIDPEAWMESYGVDRENIRDDVKTYVENGTIDHLQALGLLK